jgi:hypothetical protein
VLGGFIVRGKLRIIDGVTYREYTDQAGYRYWVLVGKRRRRK